MRSAFLLPLLSLTIALCLAGGPCSAQDRAAIDPQQVLAEFDIFNDGDTLIVPVEIAGKTYRFMVGTISTYTVFDTSLAGLLGAPIATNPTGPRWYLEPSGKIGKVSLQTGKPALVQDLSRTRKISGHAIDGVLGMSFLSTQVIHLDFDRGKLYFLKSCGREAADFVPLHFDPRGTPLVDVEVPGAGTRWFLLETGYIGCTSGKIDRWTFADLLAKGQMTSAGEVRSNYLSGPNASRWGEVRGMSLGKFSLPPMSLDENAGNELGLSFLVRFNATFDFPGRRLYLTKNRHFDEPDRENRSGMVLVREHGDTIVSLVCQGSPAEAIGIRPFDVITEIAGKNPSELRLRSLHLLFCTEGATIPLTIRRGQQEIPVTLRLGPWPFKKKEGTEGSQIIPHSDRTAGPEQRGSSDAERENREQLPGRSR